MRIRNNAKLLRSPEKLDLIRVGAIAEARRIYSVNSERAGIMYCYNDGEYAIVTASKGVVRMSEKDLEIILEELKAIKEDVEYLKKVEVM